MMKKIIVLLALFGVGSTVQAITWVVNDTNEKLLVTFKTVVNPLQFLVPGAGTGMGWIEKIAAAIAKEIIKLKQKHSVDKELFERAMFNYQKTAAGKFRFTETQPVFPGAKNQAIFSKFDVFGFSLRIEVEVKRVDGSGFSKKIFWSPQLNSKTRGGNFTLKILPGQGGWEFLMQCKSFCTLGLLPGENYHVDERQLQGVTA